MSWCIIFINSIIMYIKNIVNEVCNEIEYWLNFKDLVKGWRWEFGIVNLCFKILRIRMVLRNIFEFGLYKVNLVIIVLVYLFI